MTVGMQRIHLSSAFVTKQSWFWCKVGDACGSELKSAHHVEIEKGMEISTLLVPNGFR